MMCIQITPDRIINSVIAFSTFLMVLVTCLMVIESKKTSLFQITPDINIYFKFAETESTYLFLFIENSGMGTAQNVRFKILQDFNYYLKDHDIKTYGIIKRGIQNLYPKQKFKFLISETSKIYKEILGEELILEVFYENIKGRKYSRVYNLPVEAYLQSGKFTPPETYIGLISHELAQIKKLVSAMIPAKKPAKKTIHAESKTDK